MNEYILKLTVQQLTRKKTISSNNTTNILQPFSQDKPTVLFQNAT